MTRRALFAALASLPFVGVLARLAPRREAASLPSRAPRTISVGPGGDYAKVRDAMRVAQSGDTIFVLPGIHEIGPA